MGSASNDVARPKRRKLSMEEEEQERIGDRDGDREGRTVAPPSPAEEDVCSSCDVSTLDQASSAASGYSGSVDMPSAGAISEEEEPEDVEEETSSIRRCNFRGEDATPFGEEEVIEGRRTPAEAELEAFFAAAERGLQERKKRLVEKYNFDFDREEPLEGGRYQWTRFHEEEEKEEEEEEDEELRRKRLCLGN